MQTSLRKMGNSTGLIVPRPILDALGASTGTAMTLSIEDGRLIAAPTSGGVREGWAAAAAGIGDDDAPEWRGVALDTDDDLRW